MADNFSRGTDGLGTRSKDRSGVHTHIIAIDANPGGSETLLNVGQGLMAASIPVVVASNQAAFPVNIVAGQTGITAGAGAVAANTPRVVLATDQAALSVNPISGQTGIAAGAGAVGATVPRVTLASDDPLVTALVTLNAALVTLNAALVTANGHLAAIETNTGS